MAKNKIFGYSDNISSFFSHEMQQEMEMQMYRGAGRKHSREDDLNNGYIKPRDERFDECAKRDAERAYYRAGLGPHSGADNQKEDMQYSREVGVGKNKSAMPKKRKSGKRK